MDKEVSKRYLVTKSLETNFPLDFITSKNKRWIVVQQCKALVEKDIEINGEIKKNAYLIGDIEMHASFIERDNDCDSFCLYTNEIRTKYKKYEITSRKRSFKIWFTDMAGNPVDVSNFTLELLLIF